MSTSEFLKFQDKNGDLLIDKCEVELPGPEEKVCLDCVPNPKAVLTNWRNLTIDIPRFNERECKYQITVTTNHTSTGGQDAATESDAEAELNKKFDDHRDEAVNGLLDHYNKKVDALSYTMMIDSIEYSEWDLDARPNSRLKLLYSVPFEVFEKIEEASDTDDEEEEESGPIEVSFLASELVQMNIRVRKGLNLYSRYAKVAQVLENKTMIYVDNLKQFDLSTYGDGGFSRRSMMSRVLIELDQFLVNKGFNLPAVGRGILKDRVVKLKFNFSPERKLKKLTIFTVGCREKPIIFSGRRISGLNRKETFKDKTAMGYLASLRDMDRELTAREPQPFMDFLKEFTYPQIDTSTTTAIIEQNAQQTVGSCIADAVAKEAKQLGQDIIDEVLNIADVLAYQFHKNICKRSEEERQKEAVAMGESFDPNLPAKDYLPFGKNNPLKIMANNQLYRRIQSEDNVFVRMCLEYMAGGRPNIFAPTDVRDLYDGTFNKLKICGLIDFLLEAIQCLFKGLTLEEALAQAVAAALKAMSVENFGILFVGLPPEKQQELEDLVQQKLRTGNLFGEQTNAQRLSDATARNSTSPNASGAQAPVFGSISLVKPWEDEEYVERERENMVSGPYEAMTPSSKMNQAPGGAVIRRSLGKEYDDPSALSGPQSPVADAIGAIQTEAKQKFSPDQLMEAYILALIEVYTDNLLELVDILNRFPGAEIISKVIALFDCPRPPLFTPSVMDFLKDIELPFCRNNKDIVLPRLNAGILDIFNLDIFKLLIDAALIAVQRAIVNVLLKILVKICEIIGSAICKAIETAGSLAAGLPELISGRNTVKDILRESICGPQADDAALDDTIVDMYKMLGGVADEMANRDKVLAFNEAIASSVTRRELIEASLEEPSQEFLILVDNLIEFEFPELREAFANTNDIANFFKNFGKLLPLEFRDQAQEFLAELDEDDILPANPSLCASPEQIEEFCSLRSQILDGRASPEQIAQLCRPGADFGDLAEILQDGIPKTMENALPPILSDPGCNNGLLPYEPDEQVAATAQVMNKNLEQLKIDFSYDMLGNGPGRRNWGFINMVLSDTLGRPFTAHSRKVFNDPGKQQYVDFYVQSEGKLDSDGTDEGLAALNYANINNQKGAYPVYVAEWMAEESVLNGRIVGSPNVNNLIQPDVLTIKSFEDLDLGRRVTPLELPDYGYRVEFEVDYESEQVRFVEKQRKGLPDLSIGFVDNPSDEGKQIIEGYGFTMGLYTADLGNQGNYADDNVRLKINEQFVIINSDPIDQEYLEFLAKDSTFEEISDGFLNQFPRFLSSFETASNISPPIILMSEMLDVPVSEATSFWNTTTQAMYDQMFSEIMNIQENKAFNYGAEFDDLVESDADYMHPSGEPYSEFEIDDPDAPGGKRKLNNKDAILGISRNQLNNPDNPRVIYLDPNTFGGSYLNPAVYVKPIENTGWLGLIDSLFPELSPCKPARTEVIDFGEIESAMMKSYTSLSEDERLAGDPDCVTEVPYNRILTRQGKAGIQAVISAACRIHSVLHFVKSLATFSKFKPDFKNNFSDLYASYIVENMEIDFKDAQKVEFFEALNPFKDEEFWYAFLEQSVQTYGRLLDEGEITDPPEDVINALIRLNNIQEIYNYPGRETYNRIDPATGRIVSVTGLKEAKKNGEVSIFKTLKNYRNEDALATVKETEDLAKMVLKEFVKKELGEVADTFETSLKRNGFIDDTYATNLNYYILHGDSGLVEGSQLNLLGEIKEGVEEASDLITRDTKYTNGDELALPDGTPYVGYYHIHDGEFMEGEEHSSDPHENLTPFAKNVVVKAGGNGIGSISVNTPLPSKPFGIRAYLKTPTGQRTPYDISDLTEQEGNVSDVYPGNLRKVVDPSGKVTGLEGELGLRYGLEFYANIGGQMVTVTSVEIDVLDLPLSKLPPLQADSKEMFCLINNLLDDDRYKLFMKYCLPTSKLLSMIAIYNDMAFLASIGENVLEGAKKNSGAITAKPGRVASVGGSQLSRGRADEFLFYDKRRSQAGWFPRKERSNRAGFFVLSWDLWDRVTMRRTNSQLKRMFKEYYNSRDFGEGPADEDLDVVASNLKALREKFSFAPGERILPWWKRRRLRSNPFNANDELCENRDE